MRKLPVFLSILSLILLSTVIAFAALNGSVTLPTSGTVKTVGLECNVTTITWGTLVPSEAKTVTVNFRASGNTPVTLSISTRNWQPAEAAQHLTFSHNYTGQMVTGAWMPIAFTLQVDADAGSLSQFSFEILIVGSGT
jgi:hypothetical protein